MNLYGFILFYKQEESFQNIVITGPEYFLKIVGTFRMMFSKKPILIVVVCLLIYSSDAQQVNFIKYTVQDGLVANPVRCIYQDKRGFIWIGTFEGLSRYDGYKFINYTNTDGLSHNVINSIIEENDKLLIAENNGAIDVIQNNSIQKRVMAPSAVNIVMPYKNRLLVTTDASGFYEYKNNSLLSPIQQRTGTALGHFLPINDSLFLCDGVDDNLFIYNRDLTVVSSLKDLGLHFYSLFQDSKKKNMGLYDRWLKTLRNSLRKKTIHSICSAAFRIQLSSVDQCNCNINDRRRRWQFLDRDEQGTGPDLCQWKVLYIQRKGWPPVRHNFCPLF